ncbi:MAG: UvrD-helicase domain-containing protein [Opitutales bacterium]|nr:UvrD-helicase domain-containing protein [Opitutales bacterium]
MTKSNQYFSNEKVSASAGSGKTFSLTTRFIALACVKSKDENFNPFSIIALTFTKKAAGEFLSKILTRLADAVLSEKQANALADATSEVLPMLSGEMRPTRDTFAKVLKLCARDINRLHLSTIDSFFSTIIKQNSNTLKIFAPVSIADEEGFQAQQFMLESIAKMLEHNALSEEEMRAFAELVKKAAFGKEQKQYRDVIENAVEIAHEKYLQNRDISLWGNAEKSGIKYEHTTFDEKTYASNFEIVERELTTQKEFAKLLDFLKEPINSNLKSVTSSVVSYVLQAKREGKLKQITTIPYSKKSIPISCAKQIDEMLDVIFTEHFNRLCQATKAVAKIASLFEDEYEEAVRSRGNITFSDMPFILSDPERETEKQLIEYKLDAKFNHWLFDEFQDTSIIQWNVLRNLAEEAILSPDKSFYYVGDIKQSIYSWRGATPALFNGISDYYNKNAQLISKSKPLTVSWRSGEFVIDAVNRIFGNNKMLARDFNNDSAKIFSSEFQEHVSAESLGYKPKQPSYARLQFYEASRNSDDDTTEICKEILSILQETEPLKRGITCAILVAKNSQANTIVDFLKENGYNASGELAVQISRDRPIVSLFSAILRRLIHPLNNASNAYCELANVSDFTDNFSNEFIEKTTLKLFTDGFKSFAQQYKNFMLKKFPKLKNAIEFKWLNDACTQLDNNGIFSIDEAVEFINTRKVNTTSSKSVIQVMTIHKSKGLAFGMVIMPTKIEIRPRQTIQNIGNAIMMSPSSTLAMMNDTLYKAYMANKTSESFETICKIYVAATRPEHALYILTPKFAESAFTSNPESDIPFQRLLLEAFEPQFKTFTTPKDAKNLYKEILANGGLLDIGETNWFENLKLKQEVSTQRFPENISDITYVSDIESFAPSSTNFPKNEDKIQAELGTKIHNFFEKLTSLKNTNTNDLISDFIDNSKLQKGISTLLANNDFRKFFDVENSFEANELPFSRIENDKQIVGTIDRVVAIKNGPNFEKVFVIDYKPNTINIQKYSSQLSQYKLAVSDIFNVPLENITCFIVGYFDGKVAKV